MGELETYGGMRYYCLVEQLAPSPTRHAVAIYLSSIELKDISYIHPILLFRNSEYIPHTTH